MSNYTRQQLARIGELDAAIDSSADQGDDVFFAAVAAKDEYIDAEGIDRDQLEVTGREVKVHFTNIVWDTDGLVANLPTEAILEMADDADIDLEGADALSDKFGFCVKSFQTPREYYVWCDDDCQNKTSSLEEAKKWRDEFIAQGRASWIVGDNGTYITDGEKSQLRSSRRAKRKMSNYIEHSTGRCRMDDLVGDEFQILAFRDLPVTHQLAIAHYMSIDCGLWQCFYEGDTASLCEYVREYGGQLFGVIDLPSQRVTQSVMADPELATSYSSWEQYAAWYCAAGDVPEHDPEHRWPVILSQDNEETLRDGWHRFHCYMRSGCNNIPAVFFPAERHYELSQRNGAAHSAPLGVLDDSPGLGM